METPHLTNRVKQEHEVKLLIAKMLLLTHFAPIFKVFALLNIPCNRAGINSPSIIFPNAQTIQKNNKVRLSYSSFRVAKNS